ncbi:MAG TPA: class I SAM-dependent methyltransferase [Burkholderiales bacterium]|nr:class I SAM-dependent methyltransferase [Burkholderiales bacterium]
MSPQPATSDADAVSAQTPGFALYTWLTALTVQCAAAVAAFIVGLAALMLGGLAPSWAGFALLQGFLALRIAQCSGAPWWWLALHASFVPALAATLHFDVPPQWFLAGFVLLVLVYWSTFRSKVPLHLSSAGVPEALAALIPRREGFEFIDLGCGIGGPLVQLSRLRPDGGYHGVEVAPLPFLVSALRSLACGGRVRVRYGDFWKLDLSRYDVVYAYLSPLPMQRLMAKARAEMRRGTLLVSNSFATIDAKPHASVTVPDARGSVLHVWRM